MLIEFSVENYLSFKDRVTLSMVASTDEALPNNVIENAQGTKFNLLKSAAIYGANASGKSNLIKAFGLMKGLILDSPSERYKDSPITLSPFKLDARKKSEPSVFEITFLLEGKKFRYGFSADTNFIHKEWLYHYPKGQQAKLFIRTLKNQKDLIYNYNYGSQWKGGRKTIERITRNNSLFVSIATAFNNKLTENVVEWYLNNFISVTSFPVYMSEQEYTSEKSSDNPEMKKWAKIFLKLADPGINNFETTKKLLGELAAFSAMPDKIMKGIVDLYGGPDQKKHEIKTFHRGLDAKGKYTIIPFNFEENSDGTQKFYALAGPIRHVLTNCCTLFADELDVRLHPHLTKWLIKLFQEKETNPKGAQLIFATHDSSLLDKELFRRDQIWFTEKDENGATGLFSLWDFKIRKEENFGKGYLMGRYGAIPFIGNVLDIDNE